MNIDTDTQYAFTRPSSSICSKLRRGAQGGRGVGNKKAYDPRNYLAAAEKGMAERVKQAAGAGHGTTMAG